MKKVHPIAAFGAVALISLAMASYAYLATQEAARIKFVATANDAQDRIESRMELQLSLLRATKALFESQDGAVSPSEYAAFFKALDVSGQFAGLHGIGFIRVVKAGEEAFIERKLTENLGVERKVHPPSSLPRRGVTMLVEPHDGYSDPVIGFDMMVDPARREAIERALEDDKVYATGRVLMGDKTGASRNFAGFLVFTRLTRQAASDLPGTGLVYNAFRAEDLFRTALTKAPQLPVSVEVYDGDVSDRSLMFRSETPPFASLSKSLSTVRQFTLAGRQWTVLFQPTSEFVSPSSRGIPLLLGLFGLLLAGAIALFLRYQQKALEAASTLHEATGKSLLEKELMLQEMKHRIKNSIARVLAIARQTAAQAEDIDQFSSSFSARLQAMAASQDMLTRSRWQKADLCDLLRIELGQVLGKELPEDLLEGPQVLLDETTTQALGLTFHELATNALKYGKVSSVVNSLKIRWRLEGRSRGRVLALDWQETGQSDLQPPSTTGFGTKLIDLNIERELGGQISRDFRPDGLKVRICIPLPGPAGLRS